MLRPILTIPCKRQVFFYVQLSMQTRFHLCLQHRLLLLLVLRLLFRASDRGGFYGKKTLGTQNNSKEKCNKLCSGYYFQEKGHILSKNGASQFLAEALLLFTTHRKYFFIPLVRSLFRMNSLTSFALLFFFLTTHWLFVFL